MENMLVAVMDGPKAES
jgi:hypothetical protein